MSATEAVALSVAAPLTWASMSALVMTSGFICGKSSTSRIAGWSQNSITMRSIP